MPNLGKNWKCEGEKFLKNSCHKMLGTDLVLCAACRSIAHWSAWLIDLAAGFCCLPLIVVGRLIDWKVLPWKGRSHKKNVKSWKMYLLTQINRVGAETRAVAINTRGRRKRDEVVDYFSPIHSRNPFFLPAGVSRPLARHYKVDFLWHHRSLCTFCSAR